MNGTEKRYAELLDGMKLAGTIAGYYFEGLKFRLAMSTFYTPDFVVFLPDGLIELHEVKAGRYNRRGEKWTSWHDDARVKIKVAAETFPEFAWKAVTLVNGEWKAEEF